MNPDKAKSALDKVVRIVSILAVVAILFAAWFSIQFAKSKTKKEFDKRQIYFDAIYSQFNNEWAQDSIWNQGEIERNQYQASQVIDRKPFNYIVNTTLEMEQFNDQFNVKSLNTERPDLYSVMKFNVATSGNENGSIPHSMASMFFLKNNPLVLHKKTFTSFDQSGNTFKSWMNTKSILSMSYDSYWDYEGIGKKIFSKDLLLEDQLIYTLRALKFSDTLNFKVDILENQSTNKLGKLTVYHALLGVSTVENNLWLVKIQLDANKQNDYYFEKKYPNQMVKMRSWDGRSLQLISTAHQ